MSRISSKVFVHVVSCALFCVQRVATVVNALFWLGDRVQYSVLIRVTWGTVETATPSSYSSRSFRDRNYWFYYQVLIVETIWAANTLSSSSSCVPLDGDFYPILVA